MGVVRDVAVVGGAAAATVGVLYWIASRVGAGAGIGLGRGGGSRLFGGPETGAASEPGGEGGSGETPSDAGSPGGTTKDSPAAGGDTSPETPGRGSGSSSSGSKGGSSDGGTGGSSGGLGGGTGGGVGHGHGQGAGHDVGDGGAVGEDGGGGEGNSSPYAGWGDAIIGIDLPPPDLSEVMLEQVGSTVYDVVGGTVYETSLPPPLDRFDPELGSDLAFWADVVLHLNYSLPPGRLDPETATHVPWINLWLDILALVVQAEAELNG